MNKFILGLAIVFLSPKAVQAQSLLNKVPSNASMVIKYSGENFSKSLPIKKFESYPFVRENLFKMLKLDSLTSLENTGIDFQQDIYQYVLSEDSTMNFVSLLHLKNASQFLQLVDAQSVAELKPEKKNGYEWVTVDAGTYIGWNNEWAMIVLSHYQNPNRYNSYLYEDDSMDSTVAVDSAAIAELESMPPPPPPAPPPAPEKPKINKAPVKKSKTTKTKAVGAQKRSKAPSKRQKPALRKDEIIEEIVIDTATINKAYDEEITSSTVDWVMTHEDSVREEKREAYRLEQEKITATRQKKVAGNILENAFNKEVSSIVSDISYSKIVDPSAHISAWFNYQDLMQQYWSFMYGGLLGNRRAGMAGMPRTYYDFNNSNSTVGTKTESLGINTSMNVFFDKDKMRIEQKTYTGEGEMANLSKDLYSSKQSGDLIKLVNPDNIGYLSASINTEAMSKYYYKWIKQYLGSISYVGEYADIVNVYVDLIEIIIDEKAISELVPGNYMFVFHDMKTKEVSYTDYVYDDNFKSTEVKKTRPELSPNFTFAMETRNEAFMKKVAALPVKYTKKGNYNYQDRGGYYELIFDSGKNVLSSIYFMVKDGKVIVTTSKKSIDMVLNNTSDYKLDDDTKKSILKNNYSFKLNTKRLIQQIGPEVNTGVNKKISNYLMENIGDFKMESSLKNGMIQATTSMAISGSHANSLEFFFNIMDSINGIIKQDKEEREQKLN
ncbi:MAG: hypothetical protein ABIN36_13490 [Ferruginibacter sp.]